MKSYPGLPMLGYTQVNVTCRGAMIHDFDILPLLYHDTVKWEFLQMNRTLLPNLKLSE